MAEKIKLTFLGTGSAIPTARRNHQALYLQYGSENILIDCGEGTQRQFRKAGLNPCKITKILISHWHGDHTLGIPGLLQTLTLNGYNKKLEIYGPRGTKKKMKDLIDFNMKWYFEVTSREGRGFDMEVHEIEEGVFLDNEEFYIESLLADHTIKAVAFSFVVKEKNRLDRKKLEKLKIPNSPLVAKLAEGKTVEINGKKVDGKKLIYKEPSKKVSFVLDTRMNENAVKISKDADVLISEASYADEMRDIARDYGHLTSVEAAEIAKRAKAKKLILIHLSQRYDEVPKKLEKEAAKTFKNVKVAEDLDRLEI